MKYDLGLLWLRKRARGISDDLQFLGFSAQGIEDMTVRQYEEFKTIQERCEKTIIHNCKILVTTCNFNLKRLIREFKIRRVIIDEASQATELSTFFTCDHAQQVVLIGDDK